MSKSNQVDNLIETDDEYPKLLSDCPIAEDIQPFTIENTAHLIDRNNSTVYFITKSPCIIGRNKTVCDIVLPYDTISRKHAKITEINGDYIIEDLGSKHSTTVGNLVLKQHKLKTIKLNSGETIDFADKKFLFKNPNELIKTKEKLGVYFSKELAEFLNGGEAIDVEDIDAFAYNYLEKVLDELTEFNLLYKFDEACIAIAEYSVVSCWSCIQGNFDLVYYFDGDWNMTWLRICAENPKSIFDLVLKGLESHISKKLYANELLGDNLQISLTKERSLKEIHAEMKKRRKNNDL